MTPSTINGDFYDIADWLTPAERDQQLVVRAFMEEEVRPIINDYWERGEFPMELIPKIAGMIGRTIGTEPFQFPSPKPLLSGIWAMEVGRVAPSISTFIGVHWGLWLERVCVI